MGSAPVDLSQFASGPEAAAAPWFLDPAEWLGDVVTGQYLAGARRIHDVLTGYEVSPPPGFDVPPGGFYNKAVDRRFIMMPPPLVDGRIEYEDGAAETLSQYALAQSNQGPDERAA